MSKLIQTEIDFESVPHALENNSFSQAHLDENRHKYRGQAALVLTLLQKGIRLDAEFAREAHHIQHLGRRICDLGDAKRLMFVPGFENYTSEFGIDIDREWKCENGKKIDLMVYFLPENRKPFIDKGWILNRPNRWWYSKKYTHPEIIKQIQSLKIKKS